MIVIPDILSKEELKVMTDFLDSADFVDGKLTAGDAIKHRKNNQQLSHTSEGGGLLNEVLIKALLNNQLYSQWVLPLRHSSAIFAKYSSGMSYKSHVDAAVMGADPVMRCDFSITVFLNDPEAYEGGELAIEVSGEVRKVKLPAGSAVVYPTQAIHQVAEVTSGERLVGVLWAQSQVRDSNLRRILFDLKAVEASLTECNPDSNETLLLQKSCANLHRALAEV